MSVILREIERERVHTRLSGQWLSDIEPEDILLHKFGFSDEPFHFLWEKQPENKFCSWKIFDCPKLVLVDDGRMTDSLRNCLVVLSILRDTEVLEKNEVHCAKFH